MRVMPLSARLRKSTHTAAFWNISKSYRLSLLSLKNGFVNANETVSGPMPHQDSQGTRTHSHPYLHSYSSAYTQQTTNEVQLRPRLNPCQVALRITAAITSTRHTQRTAARMEPRIRASSRTATATVTIARPAKKSLKRLQRLSGSGGWSGPNRFERTI